MFRVTALYASFLCQYKLVLVSCWFDWLTDWLGFSTQKCHIYDKTLVGVCYEAIWHWTGEVFSIIHWNGNVDILTKCSSLAGPKLSKWQISVSLMTKFRQNDDIFFSVLPMNKVAYLGQARIQCTAMYNTPGYMRELIIKYAKCYNAS